MKKMIEEDQFFSFFFFKVFCIFLHMCFIPKITDCLHKNKFKKILNIILLLLFLFLFNYLLKSLKKKIEFFSWNPFSSTRLLSFYFLLQPRTSSKSKTLTLGPNSSPPAWGGKEKRDGSWEKEESMWLNTIMDVEIIIYITHTWSSMVSKAKRKWWKEKKQGSRNYRGLIIAIA